MAEPRRRTRAAIAAESHESKVTVTVNPHGMPEEVVETRQVHKFVVEPAYVRLGVGVTKSMGPGTYEFLRIDVAVTVPCYAEMVEQTYEALSEQVYTLLDAEVDKYFPGEGV